MARLEFDQETEKGEAFHRIGRKNRVGRKHNHQPRGRARERARQKMAEGRAIRVGKEEKKRKRFKLQVQAYWAGLLDSYPAAP